MLLVVTVTLNTESYWYVATPKTVKTIFGLDVLNIPFFYKTELRTEEMSIHIERYYHKEGENVKVGEIYTRERCTS